MSALSPLAMRNMRLFCASPWNSAVQALIADDTTCELGHEKQLMIRTRPLQRAICV